MAVDRFPAARRICSVDVRPEVDGVSTQLFLPFQIDAISESESVAHRQTPQSGGNVSKSWPALSASHRSPPSSSFSSTSTRGQRRLAGGGVASCNCRLASTADFQRAGLQLLGRVLEPIRDSAGISQQRREPFAAAGDCRSDGRRRRPQTSAAYEKSDQSDADSTHLERTLRAKYIILDPSSLIPGCLTSRLSSGSRRSITARATTRTASWAASSSGKWANRRSRAATMASSSLGAAVTGSRFHQARPLRTKPAAAVTAVTA